MAGSLNGGATLHRTFFHRVLAIITASRPFFGTSFPLEAIERQLFAGANKSQAMCTPDRCENEPSGSSLFSSTRFVRRRELSLPPEREAVAVTLFTPALPDMRQAIEDRNVSDCDDPFSALGKAIVTGPTRSVLHVPYLPERSIQDEHIRLTNQADLTIVAITQTAESEPASDLAGQLYFAKAIAMKSGTANMCCIQCNVVNSEIGSAYDNVIISPSHTRSDLEVVAKLVNGLVRFGPRC